MARATGSYPVGHGFKSNLRYHRPVGQAAKTPPFHGGNGSSILPRVTKKEHLHDVQVFFFVVSCSLDEAKCQGTLREFASPPKPSGSSLTSGKA